MVSQIESLKVGAGHLPLKLQSGRLLLVDQRLLPDRFEYFDATSFSNLCFAVKDMVVRGAPSIGVAAAFGYALEATRLTVGELYGPDYSAEDVFRLVSNSDEKAHGTNGTAKADKLPSTLPARLEHVKSTLDATRPTAVNLRWATSRMHKYGTDLIARQVKISLFVKEMMAEAERIFDEHLQANRSLSEHGVEVIAHGARIITHCNAGPLAVCGWGSALGVIRMAKQKGLEPKVYADETRPRNQGSKLTVWELMQDNIPVELVCDNMSGFLMSQKKVDLAIVGADRIATNGDTANKIGTYNLAIVARHHGVPFYVAAPRSTFDAAIPDGTHIPIEERDEKEITTLNGHQIAPSGAKAVNPAFDVTPADLIAGIITEVGILRPPFATSIRDALNQ